MTRQWSFRVLAGLSVCAAVLVGSISASATTSLPWYSGMRAFGQSTVEPAVDYANGTETFLLTPNKAPTMANAAHASAPLYLVLYPDASTVPVSALNCTPTNCNHAQILGMKGHDHLVGIANTGGDFNIDWHVIGVMFTPKGVGDGAMNTRILTLTALQAAFANQDAFTFDTGIYFNCSAVSATVYQKATPLSF